MESGLIEERTKGPGPLRQWHLGGQLRQREGFGVWQGVSDSETPWTPEPCPSPAHLFLSESRIGIAWIVVRCIIARNALVGRGESPREFSDMGVLTWSIHAFMETKAVQGHLLPQARSLLLPITHLP